MNWKLSGPDGVEAWCVALAGCVINFVIAGLGRMSGILYVAFIDEYKTDRRGASLPFSVRLSTRSLLGPIVGILGQKYGARPVILIGSIIGVLSSASCFYVSDIIGITIIWGGISGAGAALTTTLNQAVIGEHFKNYRTTAAGIAVSGGCVGSFLFPALVEYLFNMYGLGGTFLIIAGILMNVIPAALIMKKPSWISDKKKKKEKEISSIIFNVKPIVASEKETQSDKIVTKSYTNYGYEDNAFNKKDMNYPHPLNTSKNNENSFYTQSASEDPFSNRRIDMNLLWTNRTLVMRLLTNDFTLKILTLEVNEIKHFPNNAYLKEIEDLFRRIGTDVSNDFTTSRNNLSTASSGEDNNRFGDKYMNPKDSLGVSQSLNLHQVDVTSIISANPIECLSSCLEKLFLKNKPDILQLISDEEQESVSNLLEELGYLYVFLNNIKKDSHSKDNSLLLKRKATTNELEHSNTFLSHIKTACKLYTKPLFLLICLCRAVHVVTFMPVVTTIVDFSMDKGLPEEDGKYVIAALSLGDLMGRLCLGWITDKGYVTFPRYMLFFMVIQGAVTATFCLMKSEAALMSVVAVFGLLQGSIFVRHPVLVSQYLESHEQSIAMGCLNFFSGFVGFLLSSYIGYFRDTIGSYDGMFYINGSVGAFVGFLWIFEPYFLNFSRSRSKE